jgi:DNA-binding NarL/FixJ family response regulator
MTPDESYGQHDGNSTRGKCGLISLEPWEDLPRRAMTHGRELAIAIIDGRSLIAECLATSLRSIDPSLDICQFRSSLDYISATEGSGSKFSVVLICTTSPENDAVQLFEAITAMECSEHAADVVLFADINDASFLIDAIKHGVRGYIPSSSSLEVAVKAIKLVVAGGVYVPASSVFSLASELSKTVKADEEEHQGMFTQRQISVLGALRSGKGNKTIAYQLNMCESTVKVHVRNIMKRLNAKNRTEVAYILNNMEQEGKIFNRPKTTYADRNPQRLS